MASITRRLYPSGRVSWRAQFRDNGLMVERCFPARAAAEDWAAANAPLPRRVANATPEPAPGGSGVTFVTGRRARDAVVEEVEFFLSIGETTTAISAALRMRASAIQRTLYRARRHDLARRIEVK